MSAPDNSPAFPCLDSSDGYLCLREPGMFMRDYFAGQVAATALAWAIDECDEGYASVAAKLAYQFADAMLAERSKEQSNG